MRILTDAIILCSIGYGLVLGMSAFYELGKTIPPSQKVVQTETLQVAEQRKIEDLDEELDQETIASAEEQEKELDMVEFSDESDLEPQKPQQAGMGLPLIE